jgi:hypothetical protein
MLAAAALAAESRISIWLGLQRVFSVFAIAAAIGGVIWISTVVLTTVHFPL